MIKSDIIMNNVPFSVLNIWGLDQGSSYFILVLLLLSFILVGIYLIFSQYRKDFEFKRQDLIVQVNKLKLKTELLTDELIKLKEKLEKDEKESGNWEEEKQKLSLEIEKIKEQISKLVPKESDKEKDVIIEYYMKNNDSE